MGEDQVLLDTTELYFGGKKLGVISSKINEKIACVPAMLKDSEATEVVVPMALSGSISFTLDSAPTELINLLYPGYDMNLLCYPELDIALVIPPRNGHYRTKRLKKKWARLHGEPSFGRLCDYYRDVKRYYKRR